MNKLIKIIIVSLSFNYVSYSQDINDKQIIEYAIDNIEEFKDFLSYPNDANKRSDIVNLIKWSQENFQNLGFNITKLQTPTIPLLLAEKIYNKKYKTILIYLHLDGQPVDNSKWNQNNPYEPVLKSRNDKQEFVQVRWDVLKNITLEEIEENDYNLNISRYIDTSDEEIITGIKSSSKMLFFFLFLNKSFKAADLSIKSRTFLFLGKG